MTTPQLISDLRSLMSYGVRTPPYEIQILQIQISRQHEYGVCVVCKARTAADAF
jgi:hypothetical protein